MDNLIDTLRRLLLEEPWPLTLALALAGVVLLVSGLTRRLPRVRLAGGVALGLAAAVMALAAMVTTAREEVRHATRALLSASESPLDMAAIRHALHPAADLRGADGRVWLEIDQLTPQIELALTRWPVQTHRIRQMDIRLVGDQAVVDLRLSTRTASDDAFTLGTATRWRLTWQRDTQNHWQLHTLQWLEWMGKEPLMGMWQ